MQTMLDLLAHRGPDGVGTFEASGVWLGHRRLAIIDVGDSGAQPMSYGNGRYTITYNGELYNYLELRAELEQLGHCFRTESDTEVLLAAYAHWGKNCLERLNGMFAFGIWDDLRHVLFCARDRLGVKPFVYTRADGRFAFASEHKALLGAGLASADMSVDAVYEYLARSYTSDGRSFYADLEVLEPGCALEVNATCTVRSWRWWEPNQEPVEDHDFAHWAVRVGELLDDSVRLRLRSDVTVGAHLSGGLDSSSIVAAAARHAGAGLLTFTGAFSEHPDSDERAYSRAVARLYDLSTNEVEIHIDDLASVFDRIMWHMDEPIAGPGVFPQLAVCDLAASHDCKVVLGGQGGDELFAGYLRHRALYYKLAARHGHGAARAAGAIELVRMAASEWRRVKRTATRATDTDLDPEFLAAVTPELREDVRTSTLSHASARDLMRLDLQRYLPALLHVEDRTSMAASIESRTPMLDYRLVELALQIPEDMLFARRAPKPLLREAVRAWLPASVADRRDKRGFPTPLQNWNERPALRNLVHTLTTDAVASGGDGSRSVFAPQYLAAVDRFTASELWTAMTVQAWRANSSDLASAAARNLAAA